MNDPHIIYPRTSPMAAFQDYLVELFMVVAPHDAISSRAKCALMRWRGAQVGKNVKIWRDVMVDDYRKLSIGNDVRIGRSTILVTLGGVSIKNSALISYSCKILSASHHIPSRSELILVSGVEVQPVTIEEDTWICAGAIILPGVTVGRGSVVAAGAVVAKDVEPYTIVGGVPAKLIRVRE